MLNVLLVDTGLDNTLLENSLENLGHQCLKAAYSTDFTVLVRQAKPDILVFNLNIPAKKLWADLLTLHQLAPLPVIIFSDDDHADTIHQAIAAQVSAYIVDKPDCSRLPSIIAVAIARFKHQQALCCALEEARAKLEDRKQIDKAKAILIKTQGFTEDEAYHTLRKLAMDRHITLGEMAKNVIAMSELFK